jgi:monoamine oxidase
MAKGKSDHIIVIGAGAAGLMAARELGRSGKRVTILEARDRCGGRIYPLPAAKFEYPAEGGAEFVHGEAPFTRALLSEAGISLIPVQGTRWNVEHGAFSRRDQVPDFQIGQLHKALTELKDDLTLAEFLNRYFAGPEYSQLRHSIESMVEGYDAADPQRASTLALREEWMNRGSGEQARIVGGYGALIDFLAAECRRQGATINLGTTVSAIEETDGGDIACYANGDTHFSDTVILTVPLPLLQAIALPTAVREKAAASAHVGFGNVIKMVLRFGTCWWSEKRPDLADLTFLLSDATIPVWWTQSPAKQPVLTGWCGGPRTEAMAHLLEDELIEMGLASLAGIFALSPNDLSRSLVATRAINWANDPFARGAYSYATPKTREAESVLVSSDRGRVLFSGEAFYRGRDIGTVEAALVSGLETARTMLSADRIATT